MQNVNLLFKCVHNIFQVPRFLQNVSKNIFNTIFNTLKKKVCFQVTININMIMLFPNDNIDIIKKKNVIVFINIKQYEDGYLIYINHTPIVFYF
jgi:hypothetical protein